MKIFICNAFSLDMLDRDIQSRSAVDSVFEAARIPRPLDEATLEWLVQMMLDGSIEYESVVGHSDTACLFSSILGFPIQANRASIKLVSGTKALIGQYIGPRLPEGTTKLPEGARVEWWII